LDNESNPADSCVFHVDGFYGFKFPNQWGFEICR
jgi:hypothetical protein